MGSIVTPWMKKSFDYRYFASDEQRVRSLYDAVVPNADGADIPFRQLEDPSISNKGITVVFRDQAQFLVREIKKSKLVLGCVAWITDDDIIDALRVPDYGCALICQKEDFLRPDRAINSFEFRAKLQRGYEKLGCGIERYFLPEPAASLSTGADPTVDPIRCVGNHNSEKNPAFPRMHNKFCIFADVVEEPSPYGDFLQPVIKPYAVWTGSCNWSKTAGHSFENGIFIEDSVIVKAYATEWANIFCLSEPLDWESEWVCPEYRIGT